MVELVTIEEEMFYKIPNIMKFIEKRYGYENPLIMYVVRKEDGYGFVIRQGGKCLYIENEETLEMINFEVNEDDELISIIKDGYEIDFGEVVTYNNINKDLDMYLSYDKYDEPDFEDYDGMFVFVQYNKEKDLRCEIHYPHMYRSKPGNQKAILSPFNFNKFRMVFIDDKYSQKGLCNFGKVRKNCMYFCNIKVEMGDPDYLILAIKEHGFMNVLRNNIYSLYGEDYLERFCKIKGVLFDGYDVTFFPFCKTYDKEEVKRFVVDRGFEVNIPDIILNNWNEEDQKIEDIKEIVKQMKQINKKNDDEKRMIFELKQ